MAEVLLVRVGDRTVGLPVETLIEVVEMTRPFAVPSTTTAMRGVMAVRERLLPVFHLGAALEGSPCPSHPCPMAVVATSADGRAVCFEVDDAEEVSAAEISGLPDDHRIPGGVGVIQRDDAFIPIVDVSLLSARLLETGVAP